MSTGLRRRIHVDTDPGLDDLLALALALASPELRVCGVTTVSGNATLDAVTENAQRFLALARADVPLGRGADRPLALEAIRAEHFHGADGRRGISIPAVDRRPLPDAAEVLRHSLGTEHADTLVAIGPLTNVAALVRSDRGLLDGVQVVWMGGTLGRGNATATAEFNAFADPAAAAIVLGSGLDVRVVGLDVTECVRITRAEAVRQRFPPTAMGNLLRDLLEALCRAEEPVSGDACAVLHDPCAILAALDPDLLRYEPRALGVDVGEGHDRGRLRPAAGTAPRVGYASEIHHERIKALFFERLASYCEPS